MPIGAPVDSSLLFAVGSLGGRCARVGLGARTRAARPEGAYRVQRVRGGQQDQQNGGSRHNELEREPWAGHAAPPSLLLYLLLLGCPVAGNHRLGEPSIERGRRLSSRHRPKRVLRCELGDAADRSPGAHAVAPDEGLGREPAGLYMGLDLASGHSAAIVLIDQHPPLLPFEPRIHVAHHGMNGERRLA